MEIFHNSEKIKIVNQVAVGVNYSIVKEKFLFLMIVQCQEIQKNIKFNNLHLLLVVIIQDHLKINFYNLLLFFKIIQMNKTN